MIALVEVDDQFPGTVPAADAGVHNCERLAARYLAACVLVLPYQLVAVARVVMMCCGKVVTVMVVS